MLLQSHGEQDSMEVILVYSKLCLMVMTAHVHTSYSKISHSPFHITPSKLQLFEYESVYFTCEGVNISAELKVRNIRQILSKCSNSTVMKRCGIKYALASDSGEYWCESGAERSNAVSITVSAGAVILESPVHPVVEGDAVTLHCRNKITSSNFTAEFYKDNFFMGTRYEGKLEIQNVLMSHEGFYKCKIHEVGESPESWMAVRRKSNAGEDSSFRITASRLHLFETESVYFTCRGFNISTDWKVRNAREIVSQCSNGTVTKTCRIDHASASDSGEYWCESGAERSNAVSITVSSGAVILESPVHPVVEGDAVTLHCRNTNTSSNFTADFYKDNFFMGTRYEGKLEIPDVSKSHEGLYKCKIHGVGESPETWVAIRRKSNAGEVPHEEIAFSHNFYILRCTAVTVGLALQLLVLGLLQWKLQLVLSVLLLLTSHFQ
ncbi:hypothetical protein ACER0C_001693 [Sarotherodon galilaeus]